MTESLRINAKRYQGDFDKLATIGATGDGGVHRPALGENHLLARSWFQSLIISDGFDFHRDGAGNTSARLLSKHPNAATLLLGSHLDSVPYGGRFDGALGLMAAFEVLRTIREAELDLPYHLEAIDFTDEEGTFVGLLGSRALSGILEQNDLISPRGGRGAFVEALERAGLKEAGIFSAARQREALAGFLEVHIEQGPRLIDAEAEIGIVEAIVGIGSFQMNFKGRADHAGTTPMGARKDAGLGAAALMMEARKMVMDDFPECVINFGKISFDPGVYNVVPESAEIAVEYRAPSEQQMIALENRILSLAEESAFRFHLELDIQKQGCVMAQDCSPKIQEAFAGACEILGLRSVSLTSGAGHDTMSLAQVCPAGMIFIPSTGGSHNPREFARWDDCINGANVLLQAVLRLCEKV